MTSSDTTDNVRITDYLRIRHLPASERLLFNSWLNDFGQTRPLVDGHKMSDQDFYYPWDYKRWKAGLPVID